MSDATPPKAGSKVAYWIGWALSILLLPLFGMSAFFKLAQPAGFADNWTKAGMPMHTAFPIGVFEVACVVIYLIPQTSVLGAILLTGYLGGAVVTHARQDESVIAPVVIGMVIWLALALRDPRLWKLIPFRTSPSKPLP